MFECQKDSRRFHGKKKMIVHLILERQIDGSVLSRGRWWGGAHPAPVRENIDDSRNRGSG